MKLNIHHLSKTLLILLVLAQAVSSYRYNVYTPSANYQAEHEFDGQIFESQQSLRSERIQTRSKYREMLRIYEANNLEFGFPNERERQRALKDGLYNPDSVVPIDVDVFYPHQGNPVIFTTIPRFGKGVPYSLAYLTNVLKPNGTEIQPFPSYEWHSSHGADCNGLTSVYRVQIDPCGQMWVLDTGEIDMVQYCPPSIAVFNLATSQLIYRHYFPEKVYKKNISRFVSPVVDFVEPPHVGHCRDAFVYSSDATGFGFVVSHVVLGSHEQARSWRIENKHTLPDPDFSTHTIAGESFELNEGTLDFTITPPNLGLQRMLFFHSISSDRHIAVSLNLVRNESIWSNGINSALDKFIILGARGTQCIAEAMTSNGYLVCGHYKPIALVAWDIRQPYTERSRFPIIENPVTLQFVSGLKVIFNPNSGQEEIWATSNRIQKFFGGSINYKEINYRIQCCNVNDLFTAGRTCQCGGWH